MPNEKILTQSPKIYRYALRWLPAFLIGVTWLVFFWPMLCGSAVAGYRDSSYLYYPMFQWVDWQMSQGHFPLWMPYENTGFPLLADGTSSLLYPGKAIFLLRWMSFPARYGWYLALHVLLAAAGSYQMAKTLGANRWGATLAAISYAFGGSVLFQVCNVVYLVSAAWLPWALMFVWKMNQCRATIQATLAASVCCSMMILGGDPQMVYHVGLIAGVSTLFNIITQTYYRREASLTSPLIKLLLLVVVTSILSAVQLLPTMEWAQYSDRAQSDVPMNIYHSDFDSLVNLPDRPPVSDVYQFSQEPWSMLGLLFPNVFGTDAPVNCRWSAALPGAERIWTPSNYFGCIVFLLALSGFAFATGKTPRNRNRQGRVARVWLTWIAVWFCVASFGWYGVNWLMTECGWAVASNQPGTFRQPVGGLYWLMVTLLPKYCLFRYPAKLMVVGCLALSVLAGVSLNRSTVTRLFALSAVAIVMGIIGVAALFVPQTIEFLKSCQTTTLFGPFQFERCWNTLMFSMLNTIAACSLLAVGIFFARRRYSGYQILFLVVIVLSMIDVGVNNRWLLHPISAEVMTAASEIEGQIQKQRDSISSQIVTVSVLKTDFHNQQFFNESSPNRLAELAMWRREILFPKTHLLHKDVLLIGSFTSIWPTAFDQINDRGIAADIWMENVEDTPRLESRSDHRQDSADPSSPLKTKGLVSNWRGQTLHISFDAEQTQPFPPDLQVPILPMPGWRATFSSDENSVKQTVPLKAAGALHSRVEIPEQFMLTPFNVQCVYSPASFFGGGLISITGWLSLTLIFVVNKIRK